MACLLLGIFKATRDPPSDEETSALFAAVQPIRIETAIASFFDETTYPAVHTWQPCCALQPNDFGLAALGLVLFGRNRHIAGEEPVTRLDDFSRFVSNMDIPMDLIVPLFSHWITELAWDRPNSGRWMLAKSLIKTARGDPSKLTSILILSLVGKPKSLVPESRRGNFVLALDHLVPRLDPADRSSEWNGWQGHGDGVDDDL